MLLRTVASNTPATLAVGPRQWGYLFQGNGNRPVRVDISGTGSVTADMVVDMGVDAPTSAPTVTMSGTPKYYVARVDVIEGGAGYNKAPDVTLDHGTKPPARAATLRAFLEGSAVGSVDVVDYGRGYTDTPIVKLGATHGDGATITPILSPIPIGYDRPITQTPDRRYYYPVESVTVVGGSGYTVPPEVRLYGGNGGGARVTVKPLPGGGVGDPRIPEGGGFTDPPKAEAVTGGAIANAIMRAHLRGKYDCYYRVIDDTPESRGGPLPSNLSPVATIDAGDGVGQLEWGLPPVVSPRAVAIELWRTTSDQAYTAYRVATLPPDATSFVEDMTDMELTDYERDGYAAMPILLPNGELNANRFGVPPSDKAVAVVYQDRLWMAVDTSGSEPNVLRFSEYNEPESCPDINELVLQTNVRGHDHITALIPYGASLGIMQSRHAHRLSYVSQPIIDANVQIAAYRGCLNQRCWDEYQGTIFCMDNEGVYAMDLSGDVRPISTVMNTLFQEDIDFSKSQWFSVVADRSARCLRISVRLKGDSPGDYPTRQYCYSFEFQGWWEERYASPLVGGANMRDESGSVQCVYGTSDGDILALGTGDFDRADGTIVEAKLIEPGSGYRRPPKVTVTGDGAGAVVEAAVGTDGSLLGLYVRCGGYGYTDPEIEIEPPESGEQATGTCRSADGKAPVPCWVRTGNMEYPHDSMPVEQRDTHRNVAMLFTPTQGPCPMKLRLFYNNSPYPRINVAARDRGTGERYETQEPVTAIDMDASLLPDRVSSGVCRALFTSQTIDDFRGNDRHVAVELSADRTDSGPFVIHALDVYGVA